MLFGQHISASQPVTTSISPSVLIVEDDALIREMISLEIADAGFVVIVAETAEEGLQVISDESPSLLFTDIRLPGRLNGWQLAEEARKLLPTIPVVYATGYSDETPRLVPGGVFIRKPYRPSDVLLHLRRLLGVPELG